MAATSTRRAARLPGLSAPTVVSRSPLVLAGALSAYAGVLHLAAVSDHLDAWWGFPLFFVVVGLLQVAFAAAVVRRPRPWLQAVGVAGNVAVVLLYVASRTRGVPVGPEHSAHRLEPAGVLDLTTTLAEVVLVGVLVSLLPLRWRTWAVQLLLALGVALWALRLLGALG